MTSTAEQDQTMQYTLAGWFASNAAFQINATVRLWPILNISLVEARLGDGVVLLHRDGATVGRIDVDHLIDAFVDEGAFRAEGDDGCGFSVVLERGEPLS